MNINSVTISGNLTRDAEKRYSAIGTAVVRWSVAVNESVKQQDGSWSDKVNYIDCVMFGAYADKISDSLTKGARVCVHGALSQFTWERDGQKRSKIEVKADKIEVMERKQDTQEVIYADDCPF